MMNLMKHGIAYTRRVTQVWCGFFIVNALIATVTIFHENEQVVASFIMV